jgi:hypothetical protein
VSCTTITWLHTRVIRVTDPPGLILEEGAGGPLGAACAGKIAKLSVVPVLGSF